jgi:hypothetical protein
LIANRPASEHSLQRENAVLAVEKKKRIKDLQGEGRPSPTKTGATVRRPGAFFKAVLRTLKGICRENAATQPYFWLTQQ